MAILYLRLILPFSLKSSLCCGRRFLCALSSAVRTTLRRLSSLDIAMGYDPLGESCAPSAPRPRLVRATLHANPTLELLKLGLRPYLTSGLYRRLHIARDVVFATRPFPIWLRAGGSDVSLDTAGSKSPRLLSHHPRHASSTTPPPSQKEYVLEHVLGHVSSQSTASTIAGGLAWIFNSNSVRVGRLQTRSGTLACVSSIVMLSDIAERLFVKRCERRGGKKAEVGGMWPCHRGYAIVWVLRRVPGSPGARRAVSSI
ncbi:hypothetical protein BDZ89DRAFT_1122193 [Hymenopellis radicata]|nr:hypothetical protein BDZ89DRAFT_1122193 [Hymenopellis radicata]